MTDTITRPLPPAIFDRLVKILGRLGSIHDAEVVAAARHATRILQQHGHTWSDLPRLAVPPPIPGSLRPRPAPPPASGDWHADATVCLRRADLLTEWERAFVATLTGRRRLTAKQQTVLAKLVERVRAAGRRAA